MRLTIFSTLMYLALLTSAQTYDITVFGTEKVISDVIKQRYKADLKVLHDMYENQDEDYDTSVASFNMKLLKSNTEFAYVNTSFFKSYSGELDLIIDIVEKEDAISRLNFRKIQIIEQEIPDQLISKWDEYEALSYKLFKNGEIKDMNCPVIHCLWSFNHPDLAPFLDYFDHEASSNKEALISVLNHDSSPGNRAAAAFLLAHAGLPPESLLVTLMPAIHDKESVVRNNAMRVIYYIARAHPNLIYDYSSIINALDYPSFTDRNKALVILRSLPLDQITNSLKKKMADILVEILIKKDAHNYGNAHTVIKNLSGLSYASNDIEHWEKWVKSL